MSDRAMEILRDALQYARDSTLEEDPVPAWVEEGEALLRDRGIIPYHDDTPDLADALSIVHNMARRFHQTSKRSPHDPVRVEQEKALRVVEDHIVNEHGDD